MPRDALRSLGTILIAANASIAFLSLTNLFLVAAGAIEVALPNGGDLTYNYDSANRTVLVGTSFTVMNKGIYSVRDLDVSSTLVAPWGDVLMRYDSHGLVVPGGEERTFPVVVGLPLRGLATAPAMRLLVEDGTFELSVKVRALYTMGLTQFRSDDVERYGWRAPLGHLRALLEGDGLPAAAREVLGWVEPIVRERLSAALLDSALADGQWREQGIGGLAVLGTRLTLDEAAGNGSFDIVLRDGSPDPAWSFEGSVPLLYVDGSVYVAWEGVMAGAD
jgi:hypothetical protein